MSSHDVIVIGSGLSGIAFARFYLDINPNSGLIILEADSCLGGVWSSTRHYNEFWTQSGRRMTGFSDVPIDSTVPRDAPLFYDTFEAKYVTSYLENYVDSHVYDGTSLRNRILFKHRVTKVEKEGDMWVVNTEGETGKVFQAPKLVVAVGHTSSPNMPVLRNQEQFQGYIGHHKAFSEATRTILPDVKRVTVLGGGKSAVDMVYECVKKGKEVHWVIRKSGEGPALFFPAPAKGPRYKNSVESSATRYKACFSPSSFMPSGILGWLLRLFHGSRYGLNYMTKMVGANDQHCRALAAYQSRKGLSSFRLLDFTTSAFWFTGPLGLAQHDDFWDTIAQNVEIHRQDIASLTADSIVLDDGTSIPADALLCGTGWKSNYPFISPSLAESLGLPHPIPEATSSEPETQLWEDLLARADHLVLSRFPQLAHPPPHQKRLSTPTTTAKLYNGIAPLDSNHTGSIAFLGHIDISNSFRAAEAQAIWSTAYLSGHLTLPALERMQQRVAYMNAFSRRRYPSRGQNGDCVFFELIWYTDFLLAEVGLKSHRPSWWKWAYWVEPCLARDFAGIKEEYKRKFGL